MGCLAESQVMVGHNLTSEATLWYGPVALYVAQCSVASDLGHQGFEKT